MKKYKYLLISLIILVIDQISKYIIMTNIKLNNSIVIIPKFFKLTYTNNHGAAFSIMEGKQILIIIVSVIIFIYLLCELFKNKSNNKLINVSISFILGGLLGNLIDRIIYGHVRDFLDFSFSKFNFAIFNVGDMFIVIGVILMLIGIILEDRNGNSSK